MTFAGKQFLVLLGVVALCALAVPALDGHPDPGPAPLPPQAVADLAVHGVRLGDSDEDLRDRFGRAPHLPRRDDTEWVACDWGPVKVLRLVTQPGENDLWQVRSAVGTALDREGDVLLSPGATEEQAVGLLGDPQLLQEDGGGRRLLYRASLRRPFAVRDRPAVGGVLVLRFRKGSGLVDVSLEEGVAP